MLKKYSMLARALQVSARGRIFLSNFLFDSRKRRLPTKVMRSFWQSIAHEWDSSDKLAKPEVFVEKCSKQMALGAPHDYFCKGPPIKGNTDLCSRIIEAQDLVIYKNLELSRIGFNIFGYLSKSQITQLQSLGLAGVARGEMSSGRSFIWLTKSDEIHNLRTNHSPRRLANLIRDKLGLLNFDEDQHLIEVVFPTGVISSDLRAPTFIEGNPSLIYKSCVSVDGWGRTCDLNTYTDGLPEAVHHKTEFNENFMIKDIGQLRPPKPSFDWLRFLKTFAYQWKLLFLGEFRKYV